MRDVLSLNYTDTLEFIEELQALKDAGVSEENLQKFTEMSKRFDFFGNDKGTGYQNVDLAYSVEGYTMRSGHVVYVGE